MVKKVEKETAKKENKGNEDVTMKTGSKVRLTEKHLTLIPGEYEVEGFSSDGNPIVKSNNARVHVPLEKVEIIKPAKKEDKKSAARTAENPAVKTAEQAQLKMKMPGDDDDFYIDPRGQMTINKIDTPLGKLAQRMIRAENDILTLTSAYEANVEKIRKDWAEDEDVLMKEMLKLGAKFIDVLGKRFLYKAGKKTNDMIVIKNIG